MLKRLNRKTIGWSILKYIIRLIATFIFSFLKVAFNSLSNRINNTDLHIYVTILLTIFTGFIVTGKADINDMFMWKGRKSNYEAEKTHFSPTGIKTNAPLNEIRNILLKFENE